MELQKRGHEAKWIVPTKTVSDYWLNYPDVVIFGVYGGVYHHDPIPLLKEWKKRGAKVIYDLDDDLFTVNPDNPSRGEVVKKLQQTEDLLKNADVVTTTTDVLKKRFKKYNKNVVVCPNAIDFEKFPGRPNIGKELRIGYTGAASHWGDLLMILDVIAELQKKYDFRFVLQGMCGRPLLAEVYNYRMLLSQNLEPDKNLCFTEALAMYDKIKELKYYHEPFYPPAMYPGVLGQIDLDIGLCVLKDNKFNHAKSCIKFYEYAATGTVTVASDVLPYNKEVGYYAKNTIKDWYKKIEKLIIDKDFREKLLEKQQAFVHKNNDIKKVVEKWENAMK